MTFHVMIVPTLGCPASCSYCWSSDKGSPIMSIDTVKETVEWLREFRQDSVTVTFHGGEPLLAGAEILRESVADHRERPGGSGCHVRHADEPLGDDAGAGKNPGEV